jgi:hypothetical protein
VIMIVAITLANNRRLIIQHKVRIFQKDDREEDRLLVDRLRQALTADFAKLASRIDGNIEIQAVRQRVQPLHIHDFDDLDEDDMADHSEEAVPNLEAEGRPEHQAIILPSTHIKNNQMLCQTELSLRISQAIRYLAAIREAVAEKSFQYSHVLRSAPTKQVQTRSRASIAKINDRLSLSCQMYARIRKAILNLNPADQILDRFRPLKREDVKASTAILTPNIPGSSSVTLSWIWCTSSAEPTATSLLECGHLIVTNPASLNRSPLQFSVCTGCVLVLKKTDGVKKKCCWSTR